MSISDPGEMFLYTGDNYADPNGSPGNRLGPKVKWSIDEFKRTAAHEFGHVLGIADGFGYGYNQETFFGDIIALMSSQWDAKATRLDLELALKAHRTNSWQWWDENKDLISKFGIQRK